MMNDLWAVFTKRAPSNTSSESMLSTPRTKHLTTIARAVVWMLQPKLATLSSGMLCKMRPALRAHPAAFDIAQGEANHCCRLGGLHFLPTRAGPRGNVRNRPP